MKFILIIILVGLCTYVGYGFSRYYNQRYEFWLQVQIFLNKLNLQINFSKEKIKDIINAFETKSKELKKLLSNFLLCLEEKNLNEKVLFSHIKLLREEEKGVLMSFFKSLGHFDLYTQTKQIESFLTNFENYKNTSEAEKNKFAPLFIKLGLITGVVISLILI